MARVQYGSLVTSLKGSIGGTTFQNNASGSVARSKVNRIQGGYSYQQYPKWVFSEAVSGWHSISAYNRNNWNIFASTLVYSDRWGISRTLTGFNLFVMLYCNQLIAGNVPLQYAPVSVTSFPVPTFLVTCNASTISVDFTTPIVHTGYTLLIFASVISRAVSLLNRRSMRLVSLVSSGTSEVIDFTSAWESYYQASWPLPGISDRSGILVCICSIQDSTGYSSEFTRAYGVADV